jgi:hypothetical protein
VAQLDVKKLTNLDWVIVGGAGLAFISTFLPWYSASVLGFSASVSGWSTSYGWLGALIMIGAGVYLLMAKSGVNLSSVKVKPSQVVIGLAALGTLIVIIRWATLPSGSGGAGGIGYSYGPSAGIYLAIIAGLAESVAAFMLLRRPEAAEKTDAP